MKLIIMGNLENDLLWASKPFRAIRSSVEGQPKTLAIAPPQSPLEQIMID